MAQDAQVAPQNGVTSATTTAGYRFVYLYYIKPNSNYHRDVEVYLIDQQVSKVITLNDVIEFVRRVEEDEIEPHCYKIAHLPWHYLSYAVFVTRNAPNLWQVKFIYKGWGSNDYTFTHVSSFTTGTLSGSWWENKRLNRHNLPLGDETEEFKVKFPGLNTLMMARSVNFVAALVIKILIFLWIMEPESHTETGQNIGP
jgi:hypothetical protein